MLLKLANLSLARRSLVLQKLVSLGYPMVKPMDDPMIINFDALTVWDGLTDRHTDRHDAYR